jgi:S1-C subfamily serine protease
LGQVTLTFRGQVRVAGSVVWVDPLHNLAFVSFDPKMLVGSLPAGVPLAAREVEAGERVTLVALTEDGRRLEHSTTIDRLAPLVLGASRTPRFRDTNVEAASLVDVPESLGGVVLDRRGAMLGPWISFYDARSGESSFHVLPNRYVRSSLAAAQNSPSGSVRALGIEVVPVDRAEARERGWAADLAAPWADPSTSTMFEVQRVWGGAPAASEVRNGDLLLEIDGAAVTQIRQLEVPTAERATLRVLRGGQVLDLEVATQALDGRGVDRVVQWAGLVAHEPHREVSSQAGVVRTGVYGAWIWYGTPGHDGGILPTRRIVEVDGRPISSLDDLLAIAAEQHDGQAVRVKLEQLDGRVEVKTLEMDTRFWPTLLLEDKGLGWTSQVIGKAR